MRKPLRLLLTGILVFAGIVSGCTPTPQVIEKEVVVKETVAVEKEVTVEVEKEVPVEKVVEVVVTVTPSSLDEDEPNDTPDEATALTVGEPIRAYISFEDDVDYYKFYVEGPGILDIELADPPGLYDYDIALFLDPDADPVAFSAADADKEHISYSPGQEGPFYILVSPYEGYSASEPYSLTATFEFAGVSWLESGERIEEDLDEGEGKHYAISVPGGYERLEVGLEGPKETNFELFVKRGSPPTTESYDWSSQQGGSEEAICIEDPSGEYYITVVSLTGSGGFSLRATSHRTRPEAAFGEIIMAEDVEKIGDNNYEPVNPRTDFPAGTTRVYAIWKYEGMYDGAVWMRVWLRDGKVLFKKTQTWKWGNDGIRRWSYSIEEGLHSGEYEFQLFICNELVQTALFTVAEGVKES